MILVYVDIDDCPSLANQHYARSVPTIVAFVDNEEVDRFVGARPQRYVETFLTNLPAPN